MFSRIRTASAGAIMVAAVVLLFSACDSSSVTDESVAVDGTELSTSDVASSVVADLGLSADQRAQFQSFINDRKDEIQEPGFSWRLAAELQSELTAEQKERLLTRANDRSGHGRGGPEEGSKGRFGHGRRRGMVGAGHGFGEILTDEQKEQAKAIRESYREQMEAIKAQVESGELTPEQAHDQIAVLRESMRSEFEALLTDEQRAAMEQERAARQAERAARREEAKLVRNEVMGVDAGGSDALDAVLTEFRDTAETLRDEMRASGATREEIHAAVLALRQTRDEQIAQLLDETAFEIFQIHEALGPRLHGAGVHGGGPGGRFGRRGHGTNGPNGFGNRG